KAKQKAQQTSCLNNLRQIGLATLMYTGDNENRFPGCYSIVPSVYMVWAPRLLTVMGNNRQAFHCPTASADSAWDTNLNKTLGRSAPPGGAARDPYAVDAQSKFSLAYNDWGLNLNANPQLGLGGDVNGGFFKGYVTEAMVKAPSDMIMLGDSKPDGSWDANF